MKGNINQPMNDYDLVVIGGGPGGYVTAIRAAQLGLKTACIDNQKGEHGKAALGGTCLNVGCIPSKALLDSSHQFEFIKKHGGDHGITGNIEIDVSRLQKRKRSVVKNLTQGIAGLFKKNNVDWLKGTATFLSPTEIKFEKDQSSSQRLKPKSIVIASGSLPSEISSLPVDNKYIFDSSGALEFLIAPQKLCVVGAGVIGLELGSVWRRLGSSVTILEALPSFLEASDKDISKEALKILKKQGLAIELNSVVKGTKIVKRGIEVSFVQGGVEKKDLFDKMVVAVGRSPRTDGLELARAGVEKDGNGFIIINEFNQTTATGIYAVGDCVPGPMLAHKASEEGVLVAEHIAGSKGTIKIAHVPWIIYTWPEIAWVGPTEQALLKSGKKIITGKFPFAASGRSHARGETEGFVKIIAEKSSDEILSVHIIGTNASELISEAVTAMEFGASTEDIARTIHGHPTLSESVHEAALAASGRAIHY